LNYRDNRRSYLLNPQGYQLLYFTIVKFLFVQFRELFLIISQWLNYFVPEWHRTSQSSSTYQTDQLWCHPASQCSWH